MLKRILCFGDSNTWGWNPSDKQRYSKDNRWPGVLARELGSGYEVIEEGLSGRTTVWDDPIEGHKNGSKHLPVCLETHRPLDLVILMLGTNDLKNRFSVSAYDIANSMGVLIQIIKNTKEAFIDGIPRILLLSPPVVVKLSEFKDAFIGAEQKSKLFDKYYNRIAFMNDCFYLNTSEHIVSSKTDGIHLEASEHKKLGLIVADKVKEITTYKQ